MTVDIPWRYVLAAVGIATCTAIGALLGAGTVLVRMAVERRGI